MKINKINVLEAVLSKIPKQTGGTQLLALNAATDNRKANLKKFLVGNPAGVRSCPVYEGAPCDNESQNLMA